MLSSSLDTLLKVSKTTSPQKLFAYDCLTLYVMNVAKGGGQRVPDSPFATAPISYPLLSVKTYVSLHIFK